MARRSKRPRHHDRTSEDLITTYTVTVAHNAGDCDVCALPAAVMYDFEDGSRACAFCAGAGGADAALYRNALLGGVYGGWGWGDGV
jgi:hypothetical protein